MTISGVDAVTMSGGQLDNTQKSDILGKDDFLQLLVAQLKAQDPLNPMDNTEFTAQLAQFSSLEQLTNVNETLESLRISQTSLNNFQAVDYIGKSVQASGNAVYLTNGVSDDIHFELGADADAVFINMYDSTGGFVKTVESGALDAGQQTLNWDGTDSEGNQVPDGAYTFEVLAAGANDERVNTTTFTTGKVTGVTFKDGNACLLVGNLEIPAETVIQVTEETN
ncbi:MAG: hypothetical protein JRG68_07535 [Deltaproteobacteria bacterium]|nr:hypothetical protein [Deltaproteobacteria bacterium]